MAYISTESVADIRKRLKAAFPAKEGWKLSVTRRHGSAVDVRFMAGPHAFTAWQFDPYDTDPSAPKCRQHAEAMGRTKAVTSGGVNHYHIESQWTKESAEILAKASKIIHRDHWDKSDIQTDYFHCAFYVDMGIGRWDRDYVDTTAPALEAAA
jgi:hypothetical protein